MQSKITTGCILQVTLYLCLTVSRRMPVGEQEWLSLYSWWIHPVSFCAAWCSILNLLCSNILFVNTITKLISMHVCIFVHLCDNCSVRRPSSIYGFWIPRWYPQAFHNILCLAFSFDLLILLVFNATFNNISAISWRPVLVVEEAGVPEEIPRPWESVFVVVAAFIEGDYI